MCSVMTPEDAMHKGVNITSGSQAKLKVNKFIIRSSILELMK